MIHNLPLAAAFAVVPHSRPPGSDRRWHPVDGSYVEAYWLPVVGPTAWATGRRLWQLCKDHDYGVLIEALGLARLIGVGLPVIQRAISRLVGFGLAVWLPATQPTLGVLSEWPVVPNRLAVAVDAVRVIPGGPE